MNRPLLGARVLWRHRDNLPCTIIEVLDGCNPLFRVDLGTRTTLLPPQDLSLPDGTTLTAVLAPTN